MARIADDVTVLQDAWSRALAVLRQRGGWEVADAESHLGERLLAEGRRAEAVVCLPLTARSVLPEPAR